jgi:hypothetical protein
MHRRNSISHGQYYRFAVGISLLTCVSCVHSLHLRRQSDPCERVGSAVGSQPFDSSAAVALAGRYRLTLVSDWEDEIGHVASGTVALQPTDTLHRFYERIFTGAWRRSGNRVLWGWAELDDGRVTIPSAADRTTRNPESPGVLLHADGALELGVWRGLDGSSTTLTVRTVSRDGFAGTWDSELGIMTLVKDGRRLPNPHGHFCAQREQ